MTALEKRRYTEAEYLELERESNIKHEFYGGEIFERAGCSEPHVLVAGNVGMRLGIQLLERPCKVYGSLMQVKVRETGLHASPDVSIVCGESEFTSPARVTLLNPSVIVEVLSKFTQVTHKFRHYREMESLLEYVLISQYSVYVEHFTRQPDGYWRLESYEALEDTFTLESIGCTLELGQIYWKVALEG